MSVLNTESICLRPESAADKTFLLYLYISTRDKEMAQTGWSRTEISTFLTQQFEAQYLSYRQYFPDATYQVIEYQGEAIGRLYLQRGEDEYRLIDVSLLPEFRNQGLGGQLMQTILDEATEKEKRVTLHVEQFNPAYRLYERMGFVQVEERGIHLFMEWHSD